MSEQQKPKSFMQELDEWSDANVIGALFNTDPNQEDWDGAVERVKRAIRAKVLESYRNGQQAGPPVCQTAAAEGRSMTYGSRPLHHSAV